MEKLEWSSFTVPYGYIRKYILLMIFALWFLPGIIGIRFTLMGYALNFFWADFMFYMWYKHKILSKAYHEEQKRKQNWRDDNDDSNRME
jgi:predicted membrane protein